MDLTLALSRIDRKSLIEAAGVLDYASAPYLRHAVFAQFDAGAEEVVVELTGLRLLDAGAIRVLLYLQERGAQRGTDLRVSGPNGTVLTTLEIAGVDKQLGVYVDLDWPVSRRARVPIDPHATPVTRGHWPADATDLIAAMRALDPADPRRRRARDAVIERCLPACHHLARRYAGSGEPLGDLFQVAALGLVKAVDGFDPERGVEFGSYAAPTITGELKRYFRDRSGGVRIPRRLQELRLRVNEARAELTARLGRSPKAADIAAHLGVEEEHVVEVAAAAHAYRPMSLDAPANTEDGDATLADVIGAESTEYDLVEYRIALSRLIPRLPEREQQVLTMRFYGNLTQSEIAERVGVSQMQVSRLLTHALGFLRRRLADAG